MLLMPLSHLYMYSLYRSHFVFIAKEGSKFMLYMFSESEVDASSLVNAVQELMS